MATVVVPVTAVNDSPLTKDERFDTYINTTMTIDFSELTSNDSDADGDRLTVSEVRDYANGHGHASIVDGKVKFVPNSGFFGTATFEYLVDDEHGAKIWGRGLM